MFVHLIKRTENLVRVRSFIKRTNTNELPAAQIRERFMNVRFVYRPMSQYQIGLGFLCLNPILFLIS